MSLVDEVKNAGPLPSSPTLMLVRRHLLKSFSCMEVPYILLVL